MTRKLGLTLAAIAFPTADETKPDLAAAPRRALVVVTTYDRPGHLRRAVEAYRRQTSLAFAMIVVAAVLPWYTAHNDHGHGSMSGWGIWDITGNLGAALRPLLGTAPTLLPVEKKFFLSHWFDCLK